MTGTDRPTGVRPVQVRTRSPSRVRALVAALIAGGAAAAAALAFVNRPAPVTPDRFPAEETTVAPPDPPRPGTEAERLSWLIQILLASDPDDSERARTLLLAAGEPGRAAVAETIRHVLESNTAFAQHAFDILNVAPRASDVPLAISGLRSADPDVVSRCASLLGRLGPEAVEAVPHLLSAARTGYPMSRHACEALAKIGGAEAETGLIAIASDARADASSRQQAMVALGSMPDRSAADGSISAARACLRSVADLTYGDPAQRQTFVAAAQGLIDRKDSHPIERLRADFEKRRDPQALNLLARANDATALREIVARIDAKLEEMKRRLEAIFLLEFFPPDVRVPLLRRAIASFDEEDTISAAWELLGKSGADDVAGEMHRLLRSEADGDRGPRDRKVAALVLGSLRRPSDSAALLDAVRRADSGGDEELRTFALRAVVMGGDPAAAETVVRAMAADPAGLDAPVSLAANLATMFPGAPAAFRKAAGPNVLRALRGDFGTCAPGATLQLVIVAGVCCGSEGAPTIEPLLDHPRREVREAAARLLGAIPGDDTEAALRSAWWKKQDRFTRDEIAASLVWLPLARPVR